VLVQNVLRNLNKKDLEEKGRNDERKLGADKIIKLELEMQKIADEIKK